MATIAFASIRWEENKAESTCFLNARVSDRLARQLAKELAEANSPYTHASPEHKQGERFSPAFAITTTNGEALTSIVL
ncbi:MAG: hypothetical protein LIO91_03375 [Bacteroidales bacterium]|nr:hypothetical protein [Bacteroidales bacterium]